MQNANPQPTAQQPGKIQPRGWRLWLYRLTTMTVVPALLLGVLELGLRLFGYGYPTSFFLEREIDEQRVCISNSHFGSHFFPRGLTRNPDAFVFPDPKPAGTYRVFVLGESAALGYPDASVGPGRILEVMLQEGYPLTRFEVITVAVPAISSHVILPIARECGRRQPDLFVVYMGNNEVVGPFGPAGMQGLFSPSLSLIRASIGARSLRTGQLVGNLAQWASRPADPPYRWEARVVGDDPVRADDPRLETVYANFASNLRAIGEAGIHAGAKVVVCTVGVNLKNSAPFRSMAAADLSADQAETCQSMVAEGVRRETAGDGAAAIDSYRQALAIDGKPADLHFRLERCLAALGKSDEARRHLILACDLDALRFRADTRINEAIRTYASGRQAEGIYLADAERLFEQASPGGLPGEELFYDHVHMNFEGNYLLAHAVFSQVSQFLSSEIGAPGPAAEPASRRVCMDRLAYGDWHKRKALAIIAESLKELPFTNQLDCAERNKRVDRQLAEVKERLRSRGLEETAAALQRALARAADDVILHRELAKVLMERGEVAEAIPHLRLVLKRMPQDVNNYVNLAVALDALRKFDEALALCAEASRLDPDQCASWNTRGTILFKMGKTPEALAALKQALLIDPSDGRLHDNLGLVLAANKQFDEAIKEHNHSLSLRPRNAKAHVHLANLYRQQKKTDLMIEHLSEAAKIDPDYFDTHNYLGAVFAGSARHDDALAEYREALRINPKSPKIHFEMAKIFARKGAFVEAARHLEEALRLQPDWPEVAEALNDVRQKNGREK